MDDILEYTIQNKPYSKLLLCELVCFTYIFNMLKDEPFYFHPRKPIYIMKISKTHINDSYITDWVSGIYLYVSFNVTWTSLSVSQRDPKIIKSPSGVFFCALF